MKECSMCKEIKNLTDFNKNKTKKDGRCNVCRECQKIVIKNYYLKNGDKHREATRQRRQKIRGEIKNWLRMIKSDYGCMICGYNKHPVTLDFHHLNKDEKEFNLSRLNIEKKELFVIEVAKTVVLCACCHRLVEAKVVSVAHLMPIDIAKYENLTTH